MKAIFGILLISENGGVISWLKAKLLTCPFKDLTGVDCPGCGFQRSVIALLSGDFSNSFKLYPPTIPLIALCIFLLLHLKMDFKNGALAIKLMYILIAAMVIINYIYKVYNHQLF